MKQLKKRVEKLEQSNEPEAYNSLDLYHWLVCQGPPPSEGSYYAVKMSEWWEKQCGVEVPHYF
jgi:hypothetical protein